MNRAHGSLAGFYEGAIWHGRRGRHAHIYVFAYHPVDDDTADHRDARQWQFHVVPTSALPRASSIGLAKVGGLSSTLTWSELFPAVEAARLQCTLAA